MKTIVISYASKGREDYHKGLKRLIDSVRHFDFDMYVASPDIGINEYNGVKIHNPKLTSHKDIPYLFKFELIDIVLKMGYTKIVWLDSSLVVKKDLNELFNETAGWSFHNLGHPLYKWISDMAARNLLVNSIDLKSIPQIWGGCFGVDFNNKDTKSLFEDIKHQANIRSFNDGDSVRKGFVAHRHDQAVMSVLFNRYKVKMYDYGYILTGQHCFNDNEYGNDPYLNHLAI